MSIKHNQDDIIALKAALNAQRKQPRWWARIGTLLTWLTNLIIVCQNFPWYTIGACGLGEAEGRDGKYSLTHSLLYSVVMVGGAVNAVAVASVLMTKGGRLDLLPWLCGYVVWFCSAALLFMAGEMRKVFAKPHLWREADAAYKAAKARGASDEDAIMAAALASGATVPGLHAVCMVLPVGA